MHAAAVILRRASLLLLVAAVIAGIFGMHVVSGSHGAHAANPATLTVTTASHHEHGSSKHLLATSPSEAEQCASGSCSCAQSSSANCTPSLKTGSLAAPPPGIGIATIPVARGTDDAPPSWSYRPAAPTPGQLSISRT